MMFLLGIDWPPAVDTFALGAAACLGASYVGFVLTDLLERMKRRSVKELGLPEETANQARN